MSVHLRSFERRDPSPRHSRLPEKRGILRSVETTLTSTDPLEGGWKKDVTSQRGRRYD